MPCTVSDAAVYQVCIWQAANEATFGGEASDQLAHTCVSSKPLPCRRPPRICPMYVAPALSCTIHVAVSGRLHLVLDGEAASQGGGSWVVVNSLMNADAEFTPYTSKKAAGQGR